MDREFVENLSDRELRKMSRWIEEAIEKKPKKLDGLRIHQDLSRKGE